MSALLLLSSKSIGESPFLCRISLVLSLMTFEAFSNRPFLLSSKSESLLSLLTLTLIEAILFRTALRFSSYESLLALLTLLEEICNRCLLPTSISGPSES